MQMSAQVASESGVMAGMSPSPAKSPAAGNALRGVDNKPLESSLAELSQTASDLQKDRMIVYTGSISLSVANREAAHAQVEEMIQKSGGYIVHATLEEITFRIKPELFKSTLNDLSALGKVLDRTISTDDVTDQYTDVKLRLEVAENSRKRLMDLLAGAKETKTVLEIERDIRRLTEEIERMKGQMRLLENQVALATITVRLSETVPPPRHATPRPPSSEFGWLNAVGVEHTLERFSEDAPLKGGSLRAWLKWKIFGPPCQLATQNGDLLPSRFVPLQFTNDELAGATATGHRLRVLRIKLRQRSDLRFWAEALEQELIKSRGYVGGPVAPVQFKDASLTGARLRTETNWEGNPLAYDVWLIADSISPKTIFLIDYAREPKTSAEEMAQVEQAVLGAKIR
jgi:hypothetical protein